MDAPTSLAGQLLLAMPGMADPRFTQAVIAMCSHDPEGALGIGIGRVVPKLGLHMLLGQLGIEAAAAPDAPVHIGGPVEPQRGFVIHSRDWGGEDTIDVAGRWNLTGTLDVLKAIAAGSGPARWIVALGYAGWGAGQLDDELSRPGWFAAPASDRLMFERPVGERWAGGFAAAGIAVGLLSPAAGHA